MTRLRRAAPLLLASAAAISGCELERRTIRQTGPLLDIPGAVGGERAETPLVDQPRRAAAANDFINNPANYPTPKDADPQTLRVTERDGSIRLVSRNPRELMFHLRAALLAEEYDLLVRELVAQRTRREYRVRGKPLSDAEAFFRRHRDDILRLLAEFPMGELTPDRSPQSLGESAFRLEIPPEIAAGAAPGGALLFRRFEYVYEPDACRLLLID